MNKKYIYRDLSWLDFNARVLQEAEDESVPLLERLRFVGIFSNNLDEFFQVRYATLKHISLSDKSNHRLFDGFLISDLLSMITDKVISLQQKSAEALEKIQRELARQNIHFVDETGVSPKQEKFLKNYFLKKVNNLLSILFLTDSTPENPTNSNILLAVKIITQSENLNSNQSQYALIEIPKEVDRFVVLPKERGSDQRSVILIDDVIRLNLNLLFHPFNCIDIEAHMIKVTRDAILDLEDDFSKSYAEKIKSSVEERILAEPVRLVYDQNISSDTLDIIKQKLGVNKYDGHIPGGRYHNRSDYLNFPSLGRKDLQYKVLEPLNVPNLSLERSLLAAIKKGDYLVHTPFQNFNYVVKLLQEAAIDPTVKTIKITIYRLSKISNVVRALINAARNGKKVLAQIELQARFDESNNLIHARALEDSGVELIFGISGLKVHAKICLIERLENDKVKRYGFISTGNFNEGASRVYTDYSLLTSNQEILKDIGKVFDFLKSPYMRYKFKHIVVSPNHTFNTFKKLINQEIKNHKKGLPSGIRIKVNSLSNRLIINQLYKASQHKVQVDLIVRGICCLVPKIKGKSENIEIISIVDRFLEHSRVYIFTNAGDPKVFISSGDLMTRNLHSRVEVTVPIYSQELKNQIIDTFEIYWNDELKARLINQEPQNKFRISEQKNQQGSQLEVYKYLKLQSESLVREN
ncbi:MAG: polyphosphate kinase 1 [Flavobacteriaceae bacterium]|nr:polyphosphate kinase 1 [Flavobacteriaceae bacterium]